MENHDQPPFTPSQFDDFPTQNPYFSSPFIQLTSPLMPKIFPAGRLGHGQVCCWPMPRSRRTAWTFLALTLWPTRTRSSGRTARACDAWSRRWNRRRTTNKQPRQRRNGIRRIIPVTWTWIFWEGFVLGYDEGSHHIPIIPVIQVIKMLRATCHRPWARSPIWGYCHRIAGRITWKHGPRKSSQVSHAHIYGYCIKKCIYIYVTYINLSTYMYIYY